MADDNCVLSCSIVDLEEIVEETETLMRRNTRSRARANPMEQAPVDSEVAQASGAALRTPHGRPPPFLAKHIASTITIEELVRLRVRYSIPDTISLRKPQGAERAYFPGPGEICLYLSS